MRLLRLRISMLNMLLLFTIAALLVTVFKLGGEVGPLRKENHRLNEERGTLVIEDTTRVSAIRVPRRFAGQSGTFRVFIPEGALYTAVVAVNRIPKSGLPPVERRAARYMTLGQAGKNAFAILEPGEHQVALSVQPRGESRTIRFAVGDQAGPIDMTVQVREGSFPEATPETYAVYGDSVRGTTETVAVGEPLVLLRHRISAVSSQMSDVSYSMPEVDSPLDGMMLWIEPFQE